MDSYFVKAEVMIEVEVWSKKENNMINRKFGTKRKTTFTFSSFFMLLLIAFNAKPEEPDVR